MIVLERRAAINQLEDPEAEQDHAPRCTCLLCLCRRQFLRYTPPEDRWPEGANLKGPTYGGYRSGGGEPDRGMDSTVTYADFTRALALIPSRFLAGVGELWRETPPPHRGHRVDRVISLISGCFREEWGAARLKDLGGAYTVEQDECHPPRETLYRLLDEAASQMAVVMGERLEGRPSRRQRVKPEVVILDGPDR